MILLNNCFEGRILEVFEEFHIGLSILFPFSVESSCFAKVLEYHVSFTLVSTADSFQIVFEADLFVVSIEDRESSIELVEENLNKSSVAAGACAEVLLCFLIVAFDKSENCEVLIEF